MLTAILVSHRVLWHSYTPRLLYNNIIAGNTSSILAQVTKIICVAAKESTARHNEAQGLSTDFMLGTDNLRA